MPDQVRPSVQISTMRLRLPGTGREAGERMAARLAGDLAGHLAGLAAAPDRPRIGRAALKVRVPAGAAEDQVGDAVARALSTLLEGRRHG